MMHAARLKRLQKRHKGPEVIIFAYTNPEGELLKEDGIGVYAEEELQKADLVFRVTLRDAFTGKHWLDKTATEAQ